MLDEVIETRLENDLKMKNRVITPVRQKPLSQDSNAIELKRTTTPLEDLKSPADDKKEIL
jgi:hypothetical protein